MDPSAQQSAAPHIPIVSHYLILRHSAQPKISILNHTGSHEINLPTSHSKRETMNAIKSPAGNYKLASCNYTTIEFKRLRIPPPFNAAATGRAKKLGVKASSDSYGGEKKTERRSFLSLEEAGLIEISGLSSHERFLCRLTISSLNLLRVISEQEGCAIEELNAGKVCDWFIKDKLKREQNLDTAVLQWDDSEFML